MTPPGTHHRWLGIPLLIALAVGIGLLSAAHVQAQAPPSKMGEVLPIPPVLFPECQPSAAHAAAELAREGSIQPTFRTAALTLVHFYR